VFVNTEQCRVYVHMPRDESGVARLDNIELTSMNMMTLDDVFGSGTSTRTLVIDVMNRDGHGCIESYAIKHNLQCKVQKHRCAHTHARHIWYYCVQACTVTTVASKIVWLDANSVAGSRLSVDKRR
jgi:hypothetical protein